MISLSQLRKKVGGSEVVCKSMSAMYANVGYINDYDVRLSKEKIVSLLSSGNNLVHIDAISAYLRPEIMIFSMGTNLCNDIRIASHFADLKKI